MGFRLMKGRFGDYWRTDFSPELDIATRYDRIVIAVFIISFLASATAMALVNAFTDMSLYNLAALLAVPFFILGLMWYYNTGRWFLLIGIIVLTAVAIYFLRLPYMMFYIDVMLIGSIGVVSFVYAIQRFLFYRIMHSVESMNVKPKMNLWDFAIAFIFNIPSDLDTRNLTMDYNLKRASIPWSEIKETLTLGMMFGLFLWIYISMNPTFLSIDISADVPLYLFTIMLYIPVLVMPWAIFDALKVRIMTKYRDFHLYSGIKETLKRMVLPMFAAFMYVLIAVNKNEFGSVVGFIMLSVGMNILIIGFTSAIYYIYFESKLVDDIVSKWHIFRPVDLLIGVGQKDKKDRYPGTPERDTSEFGDLVFKG